MLKLLNWNVYYRNSHLEDVLDFIQSTDADLICLQEVSSKLNKKINQETRYFVRECVDYYKRGEDTYLMILSKTKPIQSGTYTYFDGNIHSLLHTYWKILFGLEQNNQSIYIDLEINNKLIRIHNTHLTWDTTPSVRIMQIKRFFNFVNQGPKAFVMADLNTFSNRLIGLLSAIPLSYKLEDLSINERKVVDDLIIRSGFHNPYKGITSWPLIQTGFQMDHILIPQEYHISNVEFLEETYGSDHLPQIIEIDN